MSDTLIREDVDTRDEVKTEEPGDHDRFSHFVDSRRFDVTEAAVFGTAVVAECGKVFIPTRDPKFGVCPECQTIVDHRSRD